MKRFIQKYFIPHPSNDHKPHFLRSGVLGILLAIVLIGEIWFLSYVFILVPHSGFLANIMSSSVIDLTNQNRKDEKIKSLKPNATLALAAKAKAEDMATKGYFSHNGPDGTPPWHWLEEAGYKYQYAGENLAINYFDSKDVVDAWMNSPEHRANVLNNKFTEIGIGTARILSRFKSYFRGGIFW